MLLKNESATNCLLQRWTRVVKSLDLMLRVFTVLSPGVSDVHSTSGVTCDLGDACVPSPLSGLSSTLMRCRSAAPLPLAGVSKRILGSVVDAGLVARFLSWRRRNITSYHCLLDLLLFLAAQVRAVDGLYCLHTHAIPVAPSHDSLSLLFFGLPLKT